MPDRPHPAARSLPPALVAAAGAVAALGSLAWAAAEARSYRLRRVEVPVLPRGARPLRVLHLSDLHLTPSDRARVVWVRGLAALEPDLVVDTGDNLADLEAVPTALEALAPLLERPGAFVLGSNDYFGPIPKSPLGYVRGPSTVAVRAPRLPTADLVAGLTGAGWLDLTNRRDDLEVGGLRIRFVGVDDPHLRLDRYPAGAPVEPDDGLRVGVAHAPYRRVLDTMTTEGNDLVLAGHTHGGQVCVPLVGALVTNCDLPRRYAKGLHRWTADGERTWLHVSAGIGTSPYARIRFACPPEATLLTLVPRD